MTNLRFLLGLLLAVGAATAQQYNITTVAGIPGAQGWFGDGGAATAAQLDFPLRVVIDSKGNLYIADFHTQIVRQVNSSGIINTVAGTGTFGYSGDGAAGNAAEISDVHGLAVDSSGNLYIADTSNSVIRKVDTSGNITTFAGNATFGYSGDGSAATSAQLALPGGVAVDSSGNVYISDYGNHTVRKVDSSGKISTIAGNGSWGYAGDGGPANKAVLAAPYAIAIDPANNIYVSETGNADIRKIGTDGNIHTVVSNIDAESIAVDASDDIYYPNYLNNTVQEILPNGAQVVIAGNGTPGYSGDGGPATFAQLNTPYGVALDSAGDVYVADAQNQLVRMLTPVPFSIGAVVNAASGAGGGVSPGEIVVLYGAGLGPATLAVSGPAGGFFPTGVAGTSVFFDAQPAPVLYASATQVAVVAPYEVNIGATSQVTVSYQGQTSIAAPVQIVSSAPGIFISNGSGSGQAAAINQNGTLNSASVPAALGSYLTLYVTGEGQTSPAGRDGWTNSQLPFNALPHPLLSVYATIGGQSATVTYAGNAPDLISGLMQVNVQIPVNIQPGPAVPVVVQVGSVSSPAGATIAVSAQ